MRRARWLPPIVVLLTVFCPAQPAPAAPLVRDGKAVAVVALPPDPDEAEKLAARDLIDHAEKMSGARLETVSVAAKDVSPYLDRARRDGKVPVFLGRNA